MFEHTCASPSLAWSCSLGCSSAGSAAGLMRRERFRRLCRAKARRRKQQRELTVTVWSDTVHAVCLPGRGVRIVSHGAAAGVSSLVRLPRFLTRSLGLPPGVDRV